MNRYSPLSWLAALACCAVSPGAAPAGAQTLQIVPVKVTGFGVDEPAAVRDAVLGAVGQINGESVAAKTRLSVQTTESSGAQRQTRRTSNEDIAVTTQGVVKSYQVLSVESDPQIGGVRARVEVRVAAMAKSPQLKRLRLAVVRSGKATPGAEGDLLRQSEAFDALFREALDQALVATRKFAMLDRSGSGVAEREFGLIRGGGMAIEERARMHRAAAADLLVVPFVQSLAYDHRPRQSLLPTAGGASDTAPERRWRATVQVGVLDYSSGQTQFGATVTGTRREGGDSLPALARQLAGEAAAQMLEHAFPAEVIGVDGPRVTLSSAGGLFAVGDPVQLFQRGKALADPHTGEFLGHDEKPLGSAVIEQTTTRFTVAGVDAATEARLKGIHNAQIVARRVSAETASGPTVRPAPTDAAKSTLVSDKDW